MHVEPTHASRLRTAILLCALSVAPGPVPKPARASEPARGNPRAEAFYVSAERLLARNTIDTRRMALRDLEQATLIEPDNPIYELLLARTYLRCGFLQAARQRFDRVARLAPDDADGHFGLGQVWRRDWLKFLEPASLDRAIEQFQAAARLRPTTADAWIALAPLLIERGDVPGAVRAATRGLEADPKRPEAVLARAHAAFRAGDITRADSLFRLAVPRLPRLARERFDDISPVAAERDTFALHRLSPPDQREFVERFWRDNDPDLASPENEARLEYWSRVAQAYFLFFDPHRKEWDERGEVYVRYGPPDSVAYNPITENLSVRFGTGPAYPANALVWEYNALGMRILMQDRLLSEYYLLPITMDHDPDPMPDPDSLARRTDRLAVRGGRGVFPKLPPGVVPLEVEGEVARFLGEAGPRLVAQVEGPGAPGDSLSAEWVVLDSTRHEVVRGSGTLAPSSCDPTDRRVGQFAADLPPGEYLVGLSVKAPGGRRGVWREDVEVEPGPKGLALSDVVVQCGQPPAGLNEVRLEPNPAARVAHDEPLTAYFEIYHLAPGSDGQSRFQYEVTVRSAERDPRIWIQRVFSPRRRVPDVSVQRETSTPGSLRRQYVTVPVQALPAGRYQLDIVVRDLVAGTEAKRGTPFLKTAG